MPDSPPPPTRPGLKYTWKGRRKGAGTQQGQALVNPDFDIPLARTGQGRRTHAKGPPHKQGSTPRKRTRVECWRMWRRRRATRRQPLRATPPRAALPACSRTSGHPSRHRSVQALAGPGRPWLAHHPLALVLLVLARSGAAAPVGLARRERAGRDGGSWLGGSGERGAAEGWI